MSKKGYKQTEEHKMKIRNSQKGEKGFWFGKKQPIESIEKRSMKLKGRKVGFAINGKHSKEAKIKIGLSSKKRNLGKDSHFYLDGRSKLTSLQRQEIKAGRKKPKNCELCGSESRICFDHNHNNGKFRGWICNRCNMVLGFIETTPKETLELMFDYIKRYEL